MKLRIGNGIDVHELQLGQSLIIGGIKINSEYGIKGHSDGDLVFHALVDSILGALALGDIGQYFPSSNKKWENASSEIFLNFAIDKMQSLGYKINNIDITIVKKNSENIDLLVRRSFSEHLWDWIKDSASLI